MSTAARIASPSALRSIQRSSFTLRALGM
jgi:hypothetical protein